MNLSKFRAKPLRWWLQTPLYAVRTLVERRGVWQVARRRYEWLGPYLISVSDGFFVEAGANDGISQSNTLFLEKDGWKGLLIEPIPGLAARCRASCRAVVEECALVPPEPAGQKIGITYANLMSVVDGVGSADERKAHFEAARGFLRAGEPMNHLEVPGRTLNEIFEAHRVHQIDLLCLDLEGYEAPALRGLDFRRYSPRFLLIEARFEADVEHVLGSDYEIIARDGEWDILYRHRV